MRASNSLRCSALRPQSRSTGWRTAGSATFIIPTQTIHSLYGKLWFLPGDKLRGNFYKCGEKTPQPHWGSWAKLSGDTPQLHQPAYFGDLEIDTTRL